MGIEGDARTEGWVGRAGDARIEGWVERVGDVRIEGWTERGGDARLEGSRTLVTGVVGITGVRDSSGVAGRPGFEDFVVDKISSCSKSTGGKARRRRTRRRRFLAGHSLPAPSVSSSPTSFSLSCPRENSPSTFRNNSRARHLTRWSSLSCEGDFVATDEVVG